MNASSYLRNIGTAIKTLSDGLRLSFGHIGKAAKSKRAIDVSKPGYFDRQEGIATIQFPHEQIPVPDTGRYQLHNEIDDCIVCDKCAKICPVDCITIEPIKSATEFGKTSDGTPKRIYAARFDIDMAKCCFCGLCTTVCPTECLTMSKTYDYSVTDIAAHNFPFANLSATEAAEKQLAWEEHQKAKQVEQAPPAGEAKTPSAAPAAGGKPVFKPRIKPPGQA